MMVQQIWTKDTIVMTAQLLLFKRNKTGPNMGLKLPTRGCDILIRTIESQKNTSLGKYDVESFAAIIIISIDCSIYL